ncbi:MAG: sugar ABC transporter permease [Kiritimatiellaeota bacterium]|nr:sugar ABC transporter permease [Kiritimatiellota bacterium]
MGESTHFHRRASGYLFLLPYVVLFVLFLALPLAYGLGLSLFRWELVSPAPARFIGAGNYREALGDPYFWKALWATFRFVLLQVPITIVFALFTAVALDAVSARRQAFYRAACFLPGMISISVAGIVWRWFFNNEFGLFNAWLGAVGVKVPWISDPRLAMKSLAMMTLWWSFGGPTVIFLAGLKEIPRQLHDAAAIDGAGPVQRFRYITLPLLRPVFLFVVVMSTIGGFQMFGQAFMITRGGPEFSTRVLVQYIYETAFTHYRMGYGAAMSWMLFVVIAVFSLVQFRLIRERRRHEI